MLFDLGYAILKRIKEERGRPMRLIVCLDERDGMTFGGRRQSQDRVLRARVMELVRGQRLYMSEYSAKQFADCEGVIADNDYRSRAGAGDACFLEDGAVSLDGVTELVIYRWNRHYPSDRKFPYDPETCGFVKVGSADFAGSSHEKITEDIYKRK